jgi:hypothetical protein
VVRRALVAHFSRRFVAGLAARAGSRRVPGDPREPGPRQDYDVDGTAVDVDRRHLRR